MTVSFSPPNVRADLCIPSIGAPRSPPRQAVGCGLILLALALLGIALAVVGVMGLASEWALVSS